MSMMSAVLAFALVLAGSLAVDVGRVAYVSRDQQGATDLAALDASRAVRNAWTPDRTLAEMYNVALDAANASLGVNEGSSREHGTSHDRHISRLGIGYLDASTGTVMVQYWSDGGVTTADPTRRPTEVVLETASVVDFVLGIGDAQGGRDVVKRSLGSGAGGFTIPPCPPGACPTPCSPGACPGQVVRDAVATVTVQTRLAELDANQSIIAGTVLDRLLDPDGTNGLPTFTAVGWDGLATATIPVRSLVNAGLVVGTPEQVLDSRINVADMLTVLAEGLSAGDPALTAEARTVLGDMAWVASPVPSFRLGDVVTVSTTNPDAFLDATVNVLDLVVAGLQAANRDHAIALDLTDGPTVVPGLEAMSLSLTIVEPPQSATGPAEQDLAGNWVTRATTSQVELHGTIDVVASDVTSLFGDAVGGAVADALGLVDDVLCGLPLQPACPTDDVVTLGLDVSAGNGHADLTMLQCATAAGDLADTTLGDATTTATIDADGTVVPLLPAPVLAPFVDRIVAPVLAALGLSLDTSEANVTDIQCTEIVLLPPTTPVLP